MFGEESCIMSHQPSLPRAGLPPTLLTISSNLKLHLIYCICSQFPWFLSPFLSLYPSLALPIPLMLIVTHLWHISGDKSYSVSPMFSTGTRVFLGPDGTAFESQIPWRLMQKNHLFQATIGYRVSSMRAWAT